MNFNGFLNHFLSYQDLSTLWLIFLKRFRYVLRVPDVISSVTCKINGMIKNFFVKRLDLLARLYVVLWREKSRQKTYQNNVFLVKLSTFGGVSVYVPRIVKSDNVGMLQTFQHFRFLPKSFALILGQFFLLKNLTKKKVVKTIEFISCMF